MTPDVPMEVESQRHKAAPTTDALCSGYCCRGGTKVAIAAWTFGLLVFFLTMGLVIDSYSKIGVGEYGLEKDRYGSTVDTEGGATSAEGLHWTGYNTIYHITSARYSKSMPVAHVFTPTGDELRLTLIVVYRVREDAVGHVYDIYQDSYREQVDAMFRSAAKDIKHESGRLYEPQEYITLRQEIHDKILAAIKARVERDGFELYDSFFSYEVELPSNVEVTALETVVQGMDAEVVAATTRANRYRAETELLVGEQNAARDALLRQTNLEAEALERQANAEATAMRAGAVGAGMALVFDELGVVTAEDRLIVTQWFQRGGLI